MTTRTTEPIKGRAYQRTFLNRARRGRVRYVCKIEPDRVWTAGRPDLTGPRESISMDNFRALYVEALIGPRPPRPAPVWPGPGHRMDLAVSGGRSYIVHRRLPGSPVTLCGYRVVSTVASTTGRRACEQCVAYLKRLS